MNTFSSSRLFTPQIVGNFLNLQSEPQEISGQSIKENHDLNMTSWRYDPQGAPLRSTQQLKIDWGNFENHIFFFLPASN